MGLSALFTLTMTDVLKPGACVMLLRCIQAGGPYNPLTDPAWTNKQVARTLALSVIRAGFAVVKDGHMIARQLTDEELSDVRAKADESPHRESVFGPKVRRLAFRHWGHRR